MHASDLAELHVVCQSLPGFTSVTGKVNLPRLNWSEGLLEACPCYVVYDKLATAIAIAIASTGRMFGAMSKGVFLATRPKSDPVKMYDFENQAMQPHDISCQDSDKRLAQR